MSRLATSRSWKVVCALVAACASAPACGSSSGGGTVTTTPPGGGGGGGAASGGGGGGAGIGDTLDADPGDGDGGGSDPGDGGDAGGGTDPIDDGGGGDAVADAGGGGGGSGGGGAAPAKPSLDLIDTVETKKSRADMSELLVKPAKAAADKRDWPRAIVLYQALVVARGPGSAEARRLAELWALAGLSDRAVEVLDRYVAATTDAKAAAEAKKERDRLAKIADPFAKRVELPSLNAEAKKVFKLGRAAFKKKQWGDALVYLHMGYALAPELPGFLRELGATYDKLGAKDKKIEFYVRYLVERPFGKNSDEIRKELGKEKGILGSLSISTSLPCEELWINGVPATVKLPVKELKIAPGRYVALCYSPTYEIGVLDDVTVPAGGKAKLEFLWAIIVNALENPLGRISVEHPDRRGEMLDLGITSPELGVLVPEDGHALKVILKDDMGTRTEERYVKFEPGQRHVIKW